MLDRFPAQNAAAALREPATSMVRKGRLIGTTRAAEKPLDAFWPSAAPNPFTSRTFWSGLEPTTPRPIRPAACFGARSYEGFLCSKVRKATRACQGKG